MARMKTAQPWAQSTLKASVFQMTPIFLSTSASAAPAQPASTDGWATSSPPLLLCVTALLLCVTAQGALSLSGRYLTLENLCRKIEQSRNVERSPCCRFDSRQNNKRTDHDKDITKGPLGCLDRCCHCGRFLPSAKPPFDRAAGP